MGEAERAPDNFQKFLLGNPSALIHVCHLSKLLVLDIRERYLNNEILGILNLPHTIPEHGARCGLFFQNGQSGAETAIKQLEGYLRTEAAL